MIKIQIFWMVSLRLELLEYLSRNLQRFEAQFYNQKIFHFDVCQCECRNFGVVDVFSWYLLFRFGRILLRWISNPCNYLQWIRLQSLALPAIRCTFCLRRQKRCLQSPSFVHARFWCQLFLGLCSVSPAEQMNLFAAESQRKITAHIDARSPASCSVSPWNSDESAG